MAGLLFVPCVGKARIEITLEQAIRRTLASNPALRAELAGIEALRHQANLESLKPAPTLGAELENFGGTGDVSGVHGAEATLRLGQVFELGGKRDARRRRGLARVASQENVLAAKRLELAADATRRYIAVAEAQAELALAGRQLALIESIRAAVQHRVDRSVAPEGDVALADIAVARAELAREHAQHELASARYSLASLWGEAEPRELVATGDLLALPESLAFETLAARLPATPATTAFDLEIAQIEADRAIAQAAAKPDLSLSAGVRRLETLDDQALVFSFSMPLGTAPRSGHAVARTNAEFEAATARRDAALLDARQRLHARYQELVHARTEYEALTQRMIPAAERGLRLTKRGYDDARYSILQLTQAQATLVQLELDRLAAAARYHTLLTELEQATAFAGDTP